MSEANHPHVHEHKPSLLHNILVGLSVSVVTLSLSAALGVLTGRGAFAGMLSACIIAIITSLLGGTRVQCSAPTGPMSALAAVIFANAIAYTHDGALGLNAVHFFNLILVQAALLLLLGGLLRLGRFIHYVPNVVISGFMDGIAVIIWMSQIKLLLGVAPTNGLEGGFVLNSLVAGATFGLTFLVTPLMKRIHPRLALYVPSMLMALIVMTVVSLAANLPIGRVDIGEGLHSMEALVTRVTDNWLPALPPAALLAALPFAAQIAALCYIDSLLTLRILDRITGRSSRPNQELSAQGLANGMTALLGGVPGAMATERSVMAVREGATGRVAGVAVGVFAFIQLLLLQDVIAYIPEAVFSGVLFRLGWDVFDFVPIRLYFKEWARHRIHLVENWLDRHDDEPIFVTNLEMALIVATMVITGLTNLIIAVASATAAYHFIQRFITRGKPLRDLKPFVETGPKLEADE